tara:strand:- start:302 stop:529 length:228 start_codon:yes stop_codon:yes gene_type:complete
MTMRELTQEQIKTLEDAINSLPEKLRAGKYRTMEGIEEQLSSGTNIIFYIRCEDKVDKYGEYKEYEMKSMKLCEI